MDILTTLFAGPVLPATLALGLMVLWSLLAVLGSVDLDLPGSQVDLDVDAGGGTAGPSDGLAILMMKWLNLKDVPLVLWMGTLAVIWWFISASLWSLVDVRWFNPPGWLGSMLLIARNLAVALPLTKLATQPMRGWFVTEHLDAQSLIGRECQISSSVASTEFGQVKLKTSGAPLLLNVRTDGPSLIRGTHVWITHYDAKRRLYIVSPTTASSPISDLHPTNED